MSKSSKNKKDKVPKITEEEYMAYLSALKEQSTQTSNAVLANGTENTTLEE